MIIAEKKLNNNYNNSIEISNISYDGFGFSLNIGKFFSRAILPALKHVAGGIVGAATGFVTGGGNPLSAITGFIGGTISEHQGKILTGATGGAIGGSVGQLLSPLLPVGSVTSFLQTPIISGFPGLTGEIQNLLKGGSAIGTIGKVSGIASTLKGAFGLTGMGTSQSGTINQAENTPQLPSAQQAVNNNQPGVNRIYTGLDGKTHNLDVVNSLVSMGYNQSQAEILDSSITSYEQQGYTQDQAVQMTANAIQANPCLFGTTFPGCINATNPPVTNNVSLPNVLTTSPVLPATQSSSATYTGLDGQQHNTSVVNQLESMGYSQSQSETIDSIITSYQQQGYTQNQAAQMAIQSYQQSIGQSPQILTAGSPQVSTPTQQPTAIQQSPTAETILGIPKNDFYLIAGGITLIILTGTLKTSKEFPQYYYPRIQENL